MKRDVSKRLLLMFSVFSFTLVFFGCFIGARPLSVSADNAVTQLTAEQTLALYGRQLHGTWYNSQDGLTRNLTFTYAFTMERWRPADYTDLPTYIKSVQGSSSSIIKDNLVRQQFLIYTSHLSYDANNYPWVPSNTSTHANVNLQFSVDFPQIAIWNQWFMWSGSQEGATPYHPDYSYVSNTVNDSFYKVIAKTNGGGNSQTYAFALFPWYPAQSQDYLVESRLMRAYLINDFIPDSGDTFSLSKQDLVLNDFHAIGIDGTSELFPSISGDVQTLLFFISCPQVYGDSITPPLTTTAPSVSGIGTQATVNTFETIDLSNIESGIAGMIKQQQENNYYQRIQIDQLNTIIEQLNSIYAEMVQRGEVPVSLTSAESYPVLNSSIRSQIDDSITTYTMAQLPNTGNGAQAITSFMTKTCIEGLPFLPIGLFCMAFSILCWFIFYGRGGS